MLETAVSQLRFAASLVFGIPFSEGSLDRLVAGVLETQREFGAITAEGAEFLSGPTLDEDSRREFQLRRFRSQAVRAQRETAYYGDLFKELQLDPAHLRSEDIPLIPPTPKEALAGAPHAFVRRSATPAFRATTTGTTGRPTRVFFSAHEMQTTALLNALGFLQAGLINTTDIVQISTSSRATLGNNGFSQACQRIGAVWYQTGLVEPAQALALLSETHHLPGKVPRTSFLSTYASYLGALTEYGLAAGYRPADFGLKRISVGGEIVTAGLKARSQKLFGPVEFVQAYAMTETWPFGATFCPQGHLHFEPSQGLLELLGLESGTPARPDEPGTLVATPFAPYRDASILLRYQTEDVARPIAGPMTCSLGAWPATTDILGKLRLSVHHDRGWTFPRDVLEALEGLEEVPLPARCGFWTAPGGVAVEVLVRAAAPAARQKIASSLEERGVPLRELHLVEDPGRLQHPLPRRSDLRESSFDPPPSNGLRDGAKNYEFYATSKVLAQAGG